METRQNIDVVAAVAMENGSVLLAERKDVLSEERWEFPGGKREPGETLSEALKRELQEELGCRSLVFDEIGQETVVRPDKTLILHFFRTMLQEEPRSCENQRLRRCPLKNLQAEGHLLPADRRFAAYLELFA